jgi:hypothetical protein
MHVLSKGHKNSDLIWRITAQTVPANMYMPDITDRYPKINELEADDEYLYETVKKGFIIYRALEFRRNKGRIDWDIFRAEYLSKRIALAKTNYQNLSRETVQSFEAAFKIDRGDMSRLHATFKRKQGISVGIGSDEVTLDDSST